MGGLTPRVRLSPEQGMAMERVFCYTRLMLRRLLYKLGLLETRVPGTYIPRRADDFEIDLRHCRKAVHAGKGRFAQCKRGATVYRDGTGYCRTHDPITNPDIGIGWVRYK